MNTSLAIQGRRLYTTTISRQATHHTPLHQELARLHTLPCLYLARHSSQFNFPIFMQVKKMICRFDLVYVRALSGSSVRKQVCQYGGWLQAPAA